MNETLKRSISGAVYVILLLSSILFSTESFFALFGLFLLIAVYEFCNLIQVNKIFPMLFGIILYAAVTLVSHYNNITEDTINQAFNTNLEIAINIEQLNIVLLVITLVVSIKCILFLFYDNIQKISTSSKYLYLLGYIILPFVFITKISFGINDYNPKIIIGLFILIWTSIAVIVGIMGTIGDLIESKFKRLAGVQDSGSFMPGHGGILDRLDSVIFVAPIIFLFYQILNYVS